MNDAFWSPWLDLNRRVVSGHLYEAAAAHYAATGKRALLDVAIRSAGLVDAVVGPCRIREVPNHPNIEQALVRLHEVTRRTYLRLLQFLVDERGSRPRPQAPPTSRA